MCVVSMIVDDWYDRWKKPNPYQWIQPDQPWPWKPSGPSQEEVDALRREVDILKEQIKRAQKYDKDNGEPDCSEKPDKVAAIRKVIEALGLNPDDVLKQPGA